MVLKRNTLLLKNLVFVRRLQRLCYDFSSIKIQRPISTDKCSFCWLTKNLHGLNWNLEHYPYIYITQNIQSIPVRNPGAIFYAKGSEKVQFLSNLLDTPVVVLNSLDCPTIATKTSSFNCKNHSIVPGKFKKHCAREKACFYFEWLTNERGVDKSGSILVTEFDHLHIDNAGRDTKPFNFERRNNQDWEPISAEKC